MNTGQDDNERTAYKRNVLLHQAQQCTDEIGEIDRTFLSTQPVFFSAFLIGATFCLSVKNDSPVFYISLLSSLFFPTIYFWFFYNVIKYTLRQLKLGGYRKFLETKINEEMNEPLLMWEHQLTNEMYDVQVGGVAQVFFAFPLGIGLLALAGYNLHVRGAFPVWVGFCFWGVSLAQVSILIIMSTMLITAREKIFNSCDNYLKLAKSLNNEKVESIL